MNETKNINQIDQIEPEVEKLSWRFWRKRRYLVVFMAFLGFINMCTMRLNLSLAIVSMTENRTMLNENGIINYEQYFSWSTTEKGLILSAFFYGYILTQIPAGYIALKFDSTKIFVFGIFGTAVLAIITPIAVYGGIVVIMFLRFIQGLLQGLANPCINDVWSKWSPPLEKTRMSSISFSGQHIGLALAMPICGLLADSLGWESIFYVFGIIGCLWSLAWILIVSKSPEYDKSISKDELRYIRQTLGKTKMTEVKSIDDRKPINYPWKDIIKSKPVWAMVTVYVCNGWGIFTMHTQLPTFLRDTLNQDISKIGFLTSIPYVAQFISNITIGILVDYIRKKEWLTTTQVRKYFNCTALIFQAMLFIAASYILNPIGIMFCLTLAITCNAFSICGYMLNPLDLAPKYSGILSGLGNTFATLSGILTPTVTGILVQNQSREEWRIVFFIVAGFYLIGSTVYWFWSSSELQYWAKNNVVDNNIDTNNKSVIE